MNRNKLTSQSSVGKHPDRLSHPALTAGRIGHAGEPSDPQAGGFFRTLRHVLLPLAAAAAVGGIASAALALLAQRSPDPTALIPALSVGTLALSSLAGGLTAGKLGGERALPCGLISGCLLTVLLCALGWVSGGEGGIWGAYPPYAAWLIRLLPIPMHALGGFLTRPRPQKTAHRVSGDRQRR